MSDLIKGTTYSKVFETLGMVPDLTKITGQRFGLLDVIQDSASQLVLPPVIPVMLHLPDLYTQNDPGMAKAIELIMTHLPTEITGIDVNSSLATHEGTESRTGQTISTAGRQTLEQPSPSFTIPEVYRAFVWKVINQWQEDISALGTGVFGARFGKPGEAVPSRYSVAMGFIQPDQTFLPENILEANIVAGMFPKEKGEFGMQLNNDLNAPSRTIQFTGFSVWTPRVRELMVDVATKIDISKYRNITTVPSAVATYADIEKNSETVKILDEIIGDA
jgi:hypothetical protein